MKYFMSEDRRKRLADVLIKVGTPADAAERFCAVPDDLIEVDITMAAHVKCIDHFKEQGNELEAMKGTAILAALVGEAMARGHAEDDFKLFYAEIIKSLKDVKGVNLQ